MNDVAKVALAWIGATRVFRLLWRVGDATTATRGTIADQTAPLMRKSERYEIARVRKQGRTNFLDEAAHTLACELHMMHHNESTCQGDSRISGLLQLSSSAEKLLAT